MIRAITYEFNKIKIKNKTTQNEISNLINELKDNLVSCEKKLNAINESESEDEKKKKLVYTLFGLGVLLIIIEVVYTLVKIS